MRTITEIKDGMMDDFMRNEDLAAIYGFEIGKAFYDVFSKVSLESLLLYIVAVAMWTHEALFESFRNEVEVKISNMKPHTAKWYRNMMLGFMRDKTLAPDSDTYDTTGMSEEEINTAKVVKYAAASESPASNLLIIKVAGGTENARIPLENDLEPQLTAYINEIKDVGVRFKLINAMPDKFDCDIDVYYSAMKSPASLRQDCLEAVRNYVQNLPFDGVYSNMALIDKIQELDGVKVVEMKSSCARIATTGSAIAINARYIPYSGYFTPGEININMIAD
ncbi:hypothetical protein HMPREF9136_2703 [Prevotella dentalis DSM 3688]|uniref:Baseplate protein J-like domain-containing protein n=2 Tax=Prevotella dentalis (strain ATCC 49559 / DSM 3688 / JCM 13448 / NCTC 12043 / ES 2772) TaxID=908937 RepID=F9D775_PREDD|nr:hypothetical protein [Prevotella dentalis]EGQ11441.1 hypothetical protein HMPREF9136_2703 [Prevotella dentalis DSM 3688]